jgi:hypothetical protein
MLKGIIIGVLLICLLTASVAQAQLAVADAPVLGAVAGVAGTLATILTEIQRQMELLKALANWPAIVAELQAIAQLIADVDAFITEIQSLDEGWHQLVDSGSVLCSIDALVSWKGQALQWQQRGLALVRTANRLLGRTINVFVALHAVLAGILGPTSGAQASGAVLLLIAAKLQELQSMTGAFQTASLSQDVIASVLGIQLVCLHGSHLSDWGSYSR